MFIIYVSSLTWTNLPPESCASANKGIHTTLLELERNCSEDAKRINHLVFRWREKIGSRVIHFRLRGSPGGPVDYISVPPPCAIPVQCPRGMCLLNMTSLVEFPRPMVFSQSDPARCMPRGGGTHLECHVAGELSTGRGHWTHVAGALFAYLYHRWNIIIIFATRFIIGTYSVYTTKR